MGLILIADADRYASEWLAMHLEMQGHEVVTAHSGLAAIEKLQTYSPDALVTEIKLPMRSGFEVVQFAATMSRVVPVACLLLTGFATPTEHRRAELLDNVDLVEKPVQPRELIARIEYRLGRNRFALAA